jgi:hypothetical protein
MEWLILCLVSLAVVIPIVLLWGFAGCDYVFLAEPDLPAATAPVNLVATPLSLTAVSLSWEKTDPDTVRYQVERLDPNAPDFVPIATDVAVETFDDSAGLVAGATYSYRVRAVDANGNASEPPSKTVQVDLFFKTAFERTGLETVQSVNQSGLDGFSLVQRMTGAPASPRLLLGGANVKITLRGSTAGDLKIDRIFMSRADPAGKQQDSDPMDLTQVAADVLVPANTAVTVGPPPGLTPLGKIFTLDNAQDLIIAFDLGTPGNARFGALVPASAATAFAKGAAAEAATATRSADYSSAAVLYLVEKIEVVEVSKSEG